MRASPGTIFAGVTPKPIRDYLLRFLRAARPHFDRLVLPCAGRFTFGQLAVAAGWPADCIEASDISLYSTIIGYHVAGTPLDDLEIRLSPDRPLGVEELLDNPEMGGAAVLYALAYFTQPQGSLYGQQFEREMDRSRETVLRSLRAQLDAFRERLRGMSYRPMDMWEHLAEVREDSRALLLMAPPTFTRGYEKMFDTGGRLTWREPQAVEYNPKADTGRLFDVLRGQAGVAIAYKWDDLQEFPPESAIFATTVGEHRAWLCSNRPELARRITAISASPRPPRLKRQAKYLPLADRDPIGQDAKVEIARIDKDEALYYRALWAHGFTEASSTVNGLFGGFIDGRLAILLETSDFPASALASAEGHWTAPAELRSALAVPSRRRIQRLFLPMTVTHAFRRMAFPGWPRDSIQTSCFSPRPSLSSYRGSYRLRDRHELKDGTYRLVYEAAWTDRRWEDIFREWHRKEAARLGRDTL